MSLREALDRGRLADNVPHAGEFTLRLAHDRDTPIWRAISATLSPLMRLAATTWRFRVRSSVIPVGRPRLQCCATSCHDVPRKLTVSQPICFTESITTTKVKALLLGPEL